MVISVFTEFIESSEFAPPFSMQIQSSTKARVVLGTIFWTEPTFSSCGFTSDEMTRIIYSIYCCSVTSFIRLIADKP